VGKHRRLKVREKLMFLVKEMRKSRTLGPAKCGDFKRGKNWRRDSSEPTQAIPQLGLHVTDSKKSTWELRTGLDITHNPSPGLIYIWSKPTKHSKVLENSVDKWHSPQKVKLNL
jgi:hypothetical protein